jgi:hypothetical protein
MSDNFAKIVVCDFEYETCAPPQREGDLLNVLCMVAYVLDENLRHVDTKKLWRGEFGASPPFDTDDDTLFVAYSAWAEMTCFLVLGWKFPRHIFDQHTAYLARVTSCCPTTRMKTVSGRASAYPMRAVPMRLKAGNGSTRK